MQYREWKVNAIGRWVECVWSMETTRKVRGYPVRPDGCIDIIYSSSGHLEVVGAMTRERRFDLRAQMQTVGVRFRPGMAGPFLRVSADEITDRTIALEDV